MQDYAGVVAEIRQQVQHRLQEMEQLSARSQLGAVIPGLELTVKPT